MDDPKTEGECIVSLDLDTGIGFVVLRAAWMENGVVKTASKGTKLDIFAKSRVPGLFRRMLYAPLLKEEMPDWVIDKVADFFALTEKHIHE